MSSITKVDVSKHKQQREAAAQATKKAQKLEDRKDLKFKIKAQKVPLTRGASAPQMMQQYEPSEYRIAPALMMVEGVSRGLPKVAPADYQRMKMRLLNSPDIQYLTEKVFCGYNVESDRIKLILTILTHAANEILTSATEQKKQIKEPTMSAPIGQTSPSTQKTADPAPVNELPAPERMEVPSKS